MMPKRDLVPGYHRVGQGVEIVGEAGAGVAGNKPREGRANFGGAGWKCEAAPPRGLRLLADQQGAVGREPAIAEGECRGWRGSGWLSNVNHGLKCRHAVGGRVGRRDGGGGCLGPRSELSAIKAVWVHEFIC